MNIKYLLDPHEKSINYLWKLQNIKGISEDHSFETFRKDPLS